MVQNELLVFDDMQNDRKKDKRIEQIFLKGRRHKIGIIQCEQFTQDTAHIKRAILIILFYVHYLV